MRASGIVLAGFFVAVSCGGRSNDDSDEPAGSAGTASAGTRGGMGASAGTGSGASSGNGASSGSGASVSFGEPECQTDADCQIIDTCCTCTPAPASAAAPQCDAVCVQSACGARGLTGAALACRGNRCVFDLSCNRAQIVCRAALPSCSNGQIPSVVDGCWGPCLAPTECSAVGTCDECTGSNRVCVSDDSSPILAGNGYYCVEVTADCARNPTCNCVAACFAQCDDTDGISCYCVNC